MLKFLGRMFGNADAGKEIIESVSDGVDKIWYTEEEKAEDAAEERAAVREYRFRAKERATDAYMAWVESTTGSRVARRLLAVISAGIWVFMLLVSTLLRVVAIWADGAQDKLAESAAELSAVAIDVMPLVGAVYLFYFGGPVAQQGIVAAIGRFTKTEKADP